MCEAHADYVENKLALRLTFIISFVCKIFNFFKIATIILIEYNSAEFIESVEFDTGSFQKHKKPSLNQIER